MDVRIDNNSYSAKKQNNSCCYSALSECLDEDIDELLNASQDSIRSELTMYGYDPDQLVHDLLIDLDPKIDRIPIKIHQDERPRINYFKEAFSVIQESVLDSLLIKIPKKPIWKRRPLFSGALAFLFLVFSMGLLFDFFHINKKLDINEVVYVNKEKNLPISIIENESSTIAIQSEENESNVEVENEELLKFANDETIDRFNSLLEDDNLSENEVKKLNKLAYLYSENGGVFSTDKEIEFLKKITKNSPGRDPFLPVSIQKKNTICSNNGFYSHIIDKGETLISVANKCGFNYVNLSEAKNIPILNISDVVQFNFDSIKNITKITVYQDNSFHILDFNQGRFVDNKMLDEDQSIIIDIYIQKNLSIYKILKNSNDLMNKGDLWKKVAEKINKEYSDTLIMTEIPANTKYQVNVKYRHNVVKDYYDVISVSLEKYKS